MRQSAGRRRLRGLIRRCAVVFPGILGALIALAGRVHAGGGPENVALLVNVNSDSSKTIANHYIQLRKIPAKNIVYVDWKGGLERCEGIALRDEILAPALKTLQDRGLSQQIDYVVYSSDFPWRVELKSFYPDEKFPPTFRPAGAITGLTYLTPLVMTKNPAVVMPNVNWYVPQPNSENLDQCRQIGSVPSRAFRFRYMWGKDGKHTTGATLGQRYFLSTMLGVTQGRGNTVDEILSYLRRSVAADGHRPDGTIYFMMNKDVRSVTRHACFDEVATQLNAMGVRARLMQGTAPKGAHDIIGLMTGTSQIDLQAAGIKILPGAICDHLTSQGGVLMKDIAGQMSLTEFLKLGAAGASGTVVEPYAIQAKFPLPSIQLHYARGCSLAEAFYQSIAGPSQLLIVGDPLCQPWAVFPTVELPGIAPGQLVTGSLPIAPKASAGVGLLELFVDGRVVARMLPGKTISLDTTKLPDGYHELRVVGTKASAIETQGRVIVPITVGNHEGTLEFKVTPETRVSSLDKLRCTVRQPGASAIIIRQNDRELARIDGAEGEAEIAAVKPGRGPVVLQAFSEGEVPAVSAPVSIEVQ
ncbi:MAG: TIGR03790 family protein [Planctomycetes bacterium]|nr:TIGR03790 family protein [Planctomycetota bacterium]